jgi:outer membrane receptor protein involved in Fe transport
MRTNFFTLICFLIIPFLATAQTGTLKGMIIDAKTKEPLADVAVVLQDSLQTATLADATGQFLLQAIAPGKYTLRASHIGYVTFTTEVEITAHNNSIITLPLSRTTLDLSTVTVTGHRQRSNNILATVDMQLRPVNTSQDILRMAPGLFIAQHAGGGKAEQIFLRGYDLDHGTDINISVDGMPVNMVSHAHGQGYADLHFLLPETVEKVNVEKGPYYAQKGNQATAGFVAFKTKDIVTENSIGLEAGSFNTKRISGVFNLLNKETAARKDNWYAAGEFFNSDGYFESPQDFKRINLFTKYHTRLRNNTQFTATLSHFSSTWDASGQVPDRAVKAGIIDRLGAIDDTEGGRTSRSNANLQWTRRNDKGAFLSNQFFYSNYQFNLYSNFTFFLNDPVNGDQINQSEQRNLFGYNGVYRPAVKNKQFNTELGWNIRYDAVNEISLSKTVKRVFLEDIRRGGVRELNAGAYAQANWEPTRYLRVQAGLRFDHFNFGYNDLLTGSGWQRQQRHVLSPKLSLYYTPDSRIQFFAQTGFGFHSNDARVVLENSARDILPRVWGGEAGFTVKPVAALLVKTSFWYALAQQEFVYVGDEGVVEAGGRSRRMGIDLSARYQITPALYADVDLNFAKPRLRDLPKGANYIPLAPVRSSIGGITYQSRKRWSGSLRYRFLGDRPANEDYSTTASGYCLADAVLGYTAKNLTLKLSVENIANRQWKEAQFDTQSRLQNEATAVSEIHFTPGTPRFLKIGAVVRW